MMQMDKMVVQVSESPDLLPTMEVLKWFAWDKDCAIAQVLFRGALRFTLPLSLIKLLYHIWTICFCYSLTLDVNLKAFEIVFY